MEVVFTRTGFMGLCPVIISDTVNGEASVEPRWGWLNPWLLINEAAIHIIIQIKNGGKYIEDPDVPILITGQLKKPITIIYPED